MATYKNKAVEVLELGANFTTIKFVGDEDHKAFNVRNVDVKIEKKGGDKHIKLVRSTYGRYGTLVPKS